MISYSPTPLSDGANQIARRLQDAGFIALWAGGCVRDMILRRSPQDYDIATNATPSQVLNLFPEAISVGKAFGVIRVACGNYYYEVATFRKDHAYQDGRHPQAVTFADEKTDALRRDFTINALFFDPLTNQVHDYVNGQADIAARLIRAVGDPGQRFEEDHLRMLRAIRFASSLDFRLDSETFDAIKNNAAKIALISAERIQLELTRILLESKQAGDAFKLLLASGLLAVILPEVAAMHGQAQPPQFHPEGDVFTHTVLMLNALRLPPQYQAALRLAYAVLLHDIGKPPTAKLVGDRIRFNRHASQGASIAAALLRRLRLPSDDIKAIVYCVANHMRFMDVRKMRRAKLRQLVGAPTFPIELELHRLDCEASHGDLQNFEFLREFQQACLTEPILPEPLISGHDILALGIAHGPKIGYWKKLAYEAQLERHRPSREAILDWLKERMAEQRQKTACRRAPKK